MEASRPEAQEIFHSSCFGGEGRGLAFGFRARGFGDARLTLLGQKGSGIVEYLRSSYFATRFFAAADSLEEVSRRRKPHPHPGLGTESVRVAFYCPQSEPSASRVFIRAASGSEHRASPHRKQVQDLLAGTRHPKPSLA